jgi:hypothetical protein
MRQIKGIQGQYAGDVNKKLVNNEHKLITAMKITHLGSVWQTAINISKQYAASTFRARVS